MLLVVFYYQWWSVYYEVLDSFAFHPLASCNSFFFNCAINYTNKKKATTRAKGRLKSSLYRHTFKWAVTFLSIAYWWTQWRISEGERWIIRFVQILHRGGSAFCYSKSELFGRARPAAWNGKTCKPFHIRCIFWLHPFLC